MSLITETLETFKARLAELEAQIEPLATEADDLRAAISKLEDGQPTDARSAKRSGSRSTTRKRSTDKVQKTATGRARRGHAKELVLKAAKENPDATSGQIAEITGLASNTVATTMSKLRASGDLPKRDR